MGLVVGRGGVSGRKCKGLDSDGTGVAPSSEVTPTARKQATIIKVTIIIIFSVI